MSENPNRSRNNNFSSPEGRGVGGEVPITRNQPVSDAKLRLARRFRKEMTREERALWRELRNNQLANLHFRRQQVIGGYIADFYCASARLAIEIDGATHLAQPASDAKRDGALAELGIETLRIPNESVTANLSAVLSTIAKKVISRLPNHSSKRPTKPATRKRSTTDDPNRITPFPKAASRAKDRNQATSNDTNRVTPFPKGEGGRGDR